MVLAKFEALEYKMELGCQIEHLKVLVLIKLVDNQELLSELSLQNPQALEVFLLDEDYLSLVLHGDEPGQWRKSCGVGCISIEAQNFSFNCFVRNCWLHQVMDVMAANLDRPHTDHTNSSVHEYWLIFVEKLYVSSGQNLLKLSLVFVAYQVIEAFEERLCLDQSMYRLGEVFKIELLLWLFVVTIDELVYSVTMLIFHSIVAES